MEICFNSGNDKDPRHLLDNILYLTRLPPVLLDLFLKTKNLNLFP